LELEVQRTESNLRKLESKEGMIERKISLADQAKREREQQVRKRIEDNFNRVAEQEAVINQQRYEKIQEKKRLEQKA